MTKVYWGRFEDRASVEHEFGILFQDEVEILYANYNYNLCDSKALVIGRVYGKLFEVYGSHCSCYGLEDQWEPEVTTKQALLFRLERGGFTYNCDGLEEVWEGIDKAWIESL